MSWKLSGIVKSNDDLEILTQKLLEQSVARHDISVQGSHRDIYKFFGQENIPPERLQEMKTKPVKEPFLSDDYGWILSLIFVVTVFLSSIFFVFYMGDIMSTHDNIFYSFLGVGIGSLIGLALIFFVHKIHQSHIQKQEKEGGFLIEVNSQDDENKSNCFNLMKNFGVQRLRVFNYPY